MILFFTLTADNNVMAIDQTLESAREFVRGWIDQSGANRIPHRIVSANRDGAPIYKGKTLFKTAKAIESYAL